MYLTIKQHDLFRNLLMGFEIPYRKYIAETIINNYQNAQEFKFAMDIRRGNLSTSSDSQYLLKVLPKECIKDKWDQMYRKFADALNSTEIMPIDTDMPMVGGLNLVTFALKEDFINLYNLFGDYCSFCDLAEKYRYARNKLDHPGCKTLEDVHLTPVLSFVKQIVTALDERYFIQKRKNEIIAEVDALQSRKPALPVKKHNLNEMPYSESKIVCRDSNIGQIKQFIYGNPGDLRKQHSYCIFGYGGVGKTSVVIEAIKQIVQDVSDNRTINGYEPSYIFFFSAKKRKIVAGSANGKIIEFPLRWHFETFDEFKELVFTTLDVESLRGFHEEGIIIVDNLETLSFAERKKIKVFISSQTPSEMQFIITSRNSEEYENNVKLAGFESSSGIAFIDAYILENGLDIQLSQEEKNQLLELSKGNTLVLVLCLRRLSKNLASISGLLEDFSSNAFKTINNGLNNIPPNAYEVVSEFMFKDTFEQIENNFGKEIALFHEILKVFAVASDNEIDLGTICYLVNSNYPSVETVVDILCNYLIVEKKSEYYGLNGFAEKYIVSRFIPDDESYRKLTSEISRRKRKMDDDLERLKDDMSRKQELVKIIRDWQIITTSDKIAAANMYRVFERVKRACDSGGRFKTQVEYEDFIKDSYKAEGFTAHPYIKFQKARILRMIDESGVLDEKHHEEIKGAFYNAIFTINTVEQYSLISQTKSYATLLWLFAQVLDSETEFMDSIRYLEESRALFEQREVRDQEYYQCITLLASKYVKLYRSDPSQMSVYKKRADEINKILQVNYCWLGRARKFADKLKRDLTQLE